jgi:hypothetical protein
MSQSGDLNVNGGLPPPDVPTLFVCDVGSATPALNTLDVLGAGGTTTSGSGNTITITSTGGGLTWTVVTSASNPVLLTPGNGYICKGVSAVQFTLPASAAIGDLYKIVGTANLWTIAQNANQSITIGTATSSVGVGGSITASTASDGLEILCINTNTGWFSTYVQGNPTIV